MEYRSTCCISGRGECFFFVCIGHMDVERALLHNGVHPASICALLRESCHLKGRINLPEAPMCVSISICSWC